MVNKFKQRIGSRTQVMHGTAKITGGGLIKKQLKYNKRGKIVSKKASNNAKKKYKLIKKGGSTDNNFSRNMLSSTIHTFQLNNNNSEKNIKIVIDKTEEEIFIYINDIIIPPDCMSINIKLPKHYSLSMYMTIDECNLYSKIKLGRSLLDLIIICLKKINAKTLELDDVSYWESPIFSSGIQYIAYNFRKNKDYDGSSYYSSYGFLPNGFLPYGNKIKQLEIFENEKRNIKFFMNLTLNELFDKEFINYRNELVEKYKSSVERLKIFLSKPNISNRHSKIKSLQLEKYSLKLRKIDELLCFRRNTQSIFENIMIITELLGSNIKNSFNNILENENIRIAHFIQHCYNKIYFYKRIKYFI